MKLSKQFIKADDRICDFEHHVPAPYFRRTFDLGFSPENAKISICGLGFYELTVNGTPVTKGPLAPYICNPDHILPYDCYDITQYLKKGKNAIGVLLGNGFRNSFGGFVWDMDRDSCRGPVLLACYLEASGEGKTISFEADEHFLTHASPILFNDLRMGCRYDARKEILGWDLPEFDDHDWKRSKKAECPAGEARICGADPIVVTRSVAPVSIRFFEKTPIAFESTLKGAKPISTHIAKKAYLYDFGENSAGVTVLRMKGKRGQKIVIRHGEWLQDGFFSLNTVIFNEPERIEKYLEYAQKDVYICKGGEEEIFVPKFKYDGFRYALVEGLEPEQATKEALTMVVMNSDLKERAHFYSSNDRLNRLFAMTRQSDLSNFYYFPTDCPHREKNGWTGDAEVSAEHMLLNLTAEKSLTEWLIQIRHAQLPSGVLPGIIPTGGWGYEWGNGPAWDSVCVQLPYHIYRINGDRQMLLDNAPMIFRYLNYLRTRRNSEGLYAFGLGDWSDPYASENNGKITAPLRVTDSCMALEIAEKATVIFNILGLTHEAEYAKAITEDVRRAIRDHLIDYETMTAEGNCQTSQALFLYHNLFLSNEKEKAKKKLLQIIQRDQEVNTCGMIGLRYIYHALAQIGEADLACRMIVSPARSCYGAWLDYGATSMLESFPYPDGREVYSQNHHFFGDISNFMITELVGLIPNPTLTDVNSFVIAPHFAETAGDLSAWIRLPAGVLSCEWKREWKTVHGTIRVPPGANGRIREPDGWTLIGERELRAGEHKVRFELP